MKTEATHDNAGSGRLQSLRPPGGMARRLFFLFNARFLLRRRSQTLLCIAGIALGVAVMVAIDAANKGALVSFRRNVDLVAGRATHQVVPAGQVDLDERLWLTLRQTDGVLAAAPAVEQLVTAREAGREALRVLGTDPFSEAAFRTWTPKDQPSGGAGGDSALGRYLTSPNRIILPEIFAQRHSLKAEQSLTLLVGAREVTATIHALFRPEELEKGSESIAVMDISAAQELFGKVGRVDRIDLLLDDKPATVARVERSLPAGTTLVRPSTRTERLERMIASFQMNLFALSLLAVFVGIFLIHNTLTFAVIQRRRQIGLLRCLGLTRGAAARSFLVESLVLGAVGSVIGLGLGAIMARYTVVVVGRTISEAFGQSVWPELILSMGTAVKACAVGLGVSVVAAILPALEAAGVRPTGALSRPEADIRVARMAPWFAALGALALALAYVLTLIPTPSPTPGYFGAFLILLGFALMGPSTSQLAARTLAPQAGRWLGLSADLGVRSVAASLARTGPAMGALVVALAMVVGVTLMVQSFRASLIDWIDQTIRADVYMLPGGSPTQKNNAFMPDAVLERMAQRKDVAAIDMLRRMETTINGVPSQVNALRFELMEQGGYRPPADLVAGDKKTFVETLRSSDTLIVSDVLHRLGGVNMGDQIPLATPAGTTSFTVVGIYRDYSADGGQLQMDLQRWRSHWHDQRINNCALYLTPGTDAEAVTDSVRKELGAAGYQVLARSNASLRREVVKVFDNTFAITYVMQALTAGVSFCGILAALLALLLERTRELGTLRALGMTRSGLRRMLAWEAGAMGSLAAALGMAAGTVLAALLVYVINVRSFGWTIGFHVTPDVYGKALFVALGASLSAAIYPSWRLARLPLAAALREE